MELDIWNIDKIGFQISCEKAQLIITMDANKLFYIIDPKNCDYITLVKCISSVSETILLMLLIFGVNIYISSVSTMI